MEKSILNQDFLEKIHESYPIDKWTQFIKIAEKEYGRVLVDTWFRSLTLLSWNENIKTLIINAPNKFVKDWIEKNHIDIIQKIMSRLLYEKTIIIKITFENKSKIKETESILPAKKTKIYNEVDEYSGKSIEDKVGRIGIRAKNFLTDIKIMETTLNKNYTFENFVTGVENQAAFNSAKNFLKNKTMKCDSLFVQGGSGIGKTHLMNAIAFSLKENKIPFIYQTSDRFTKEYINAIKSKSIDKFESFFEYSDYILIDDIHMLAKKPKTQEIFLKLMCSFFNNDKKIIVTSDLLPRDIVGLSDKLRSRFEGGLIIDLSFPGYETMVKIVAQKAKVYELKLDLQTIEYIAAYASHSLREIDGILVKLITYFTVSDKKMDFKSIKELLPQAKNSMQETILTPSINKLINFISHKFDIDTNVLKEKSRKKNVIYAKYIIIYLLKDYFHYSYSKISKIFNYKDHTTAMYAYKRISKKLASEDADIDIKMFVRDIHKFIGCPGEI